MSLYKFMLLGQDLKLWMNLRMYPVIPYIEGGWEKWMQVDFPAYLDDRDGVQYEFRREYNIDNEFYLDWLVNESDNNDSIAIELKCQSAKNFKNNKKFAEAVQNDIKKLQELQKIKRFGHYVMLAGAIDEGALTYLQQLKMSQIATVRNKNYMVSFLGLWSK